jgi:hypothetical protein
VSCHELLARACFDLGIKAEGSSKLTRALEDVAQARDTLWEIIQRYPRHAFNSPAVKTALRVAYLDQLVFSACNGAAANWAHWRKRNASCSAKARMRATTRKRKTDPDTPQRSHKPRFGGGFLSGDRVVDALGVGLFDTAKPFFAERRRNPRIC